MNDKLYNLPFGGTTNDVNYYISNWELLANGAAEITGLKVDSFDPCIALSTGIPGYSMAYFSPQQVSNMMIKWLDIDPRDTIGGSIDLATKDCRDEYDEEIALYETYGGD